MKQTTILFLKSYLPRDKFQNALAWVKAKANRLFLPGSKLWVLDTETTPSDPGWPSILESVADAGWKVVGESLWLADMPLRDHEKTLGGLAALAVQREEQANQRRRTKRSGGRSC